MSKKVLWYVEDTKPDARRKQMQIVAVINYKGGVGKTTATANLAAELAWRGHKILVLDLDPQASLTQWR